MKIGDDFDGEGKQSKFNEKARAEEAGLNHNKMWGGYSIST